MHNSSLWTGRKRVSIVWRMSCPLHVKDNAAPDEQQCVWSGRLWPDTRQHFPTLSFMAYFSRGNLKKLPPFRRIAKFVPT